jgi:3-isopropylmalate dehydratase small subunit
LDAQTLKVGGEAPQAFPLDAGRRLMVLNGWDEIDLILKDDGPAIDDFEAAHRRRSPWLFA